jgi:cell division protein FtsB
VIFIKKFFGLIVSILILLVIFLPGYTKIQELMDRNKDLLVKNQRLNNENALLQRELGRIERDPFYQEKILREKMGVVRKDEVPVKIVNE